MKTPTSIGAPTDAFHVEVYFNGYGRIIEFTGTGSDVFAGTLIPGSDASTEQVIANGDYEEDVDLSSCGGPHPAVAVRPASHHQRDPHDIYWLDHWEDRGFVWNPPEPCVERRLPLTSVLLEVGSQRSGA